MNSNSISAYSDYVVSNEQADVRNFIFHTTETNPEGLTNSQINVMFINKHGVKHRDIRADVCSMHTHSYLTATDYSVKCPITGRKAVLYKFRTRHPTKREILEGRLKSLVQKRDDYTISIANIEAELNLL